MAAVAAPSTPSSSSSSTFGKLFSKLRTPTTPSERDSHKNFATPTGAGAGSKSSSLRQQALTASASSTSLASQASALESPNSSTWDIEMPKFETGDWLNAAGQLNTSSNSPYGQLGSTAARASTSTFASSVVSLASSIAVSEHGADATLQQIAPSSSTLSFKALGMGSLSRARGKDVEPNSSGGSGGSSSAVDSSGDRLRKASFLSRSSTDNNAQPPPKGFSRSWTQKGKDLLNRSGGPSSQPHDGESFNSLVPDVRSDHSCHHDGALTLS